MKFLQNYFDAKAEILRAKAKALLPCEHDWEFLEKRELFYKLNPENKWSEYLYRCRKCCKAKKISGNDDNINFIYR